VVAAGVSGIIAPGRVSAIQQWAEPKEQIVSVESIPEEQLQRWFEQAVADERLASAIRNVPALRERLAQLRAIWRATDQVTRDGLENALDIYGHLCEAEALSANESITLQGFNQMRPDLVLHTGSAHYILVELKTRPAPERQGVQELLAYSAAIKMAMPYANDTLFVIVASSWDTLLQFSVRALILDGKRVLPLQWTSPAPGNFEFNVRLDLFEFDFVEEYDPFYALSTAIFACTRPALESAAVSGYFGWHAQRAVADCRRMQQCGFILTWSLSDWFDGTVSTALVTFNQHWRESEYLPPNFREFAEDHRPGIVRLIHKQVARICDPLLHGCDDGDIYRVNLAADEHRRHFPQNGASYEILERRRSRPWEAELQRRNARTGNFETSDFKNLECLVGHITERQDSIRVENFMPFGELEDYARQEDRLVWHDLGDVLELLYLFRENKGYSRFGPIPSEE
jgi:hypothetical protein